MEENEVSPTFNKDIQNEIIMSPLRNVAFKTGRVSANINGDHIEVYVGN